MLVMVPEVDFKIERRGPVIQPGYGALNTKNSACPRCVYLQQY